MPIRRETPKETFKRTELRCLEKYKLAIASVHSNNTVIMLLAMALRFKRQGAFRKHVLALRLAAVVAEMLDVNANLATLPRQGDAHGGPYKEMSDYHDSTFFQQFRF